MLKDVPSLELLLKTLQQVPYLASKNLYRVGSYFLTLDQEKIEQLCAVLLQAKQRVIPCSICCNWQEVDRECSICSAPKRDQTIVCVVESWQDLLAIDKTGGYQGLFHVLGGVISPLEGIGPEELSIELLVQRLESGVINEVILALNQTPEGEATSAYVGKKVRERGVHVTCLARGIPVGSHLESMDRLTVFKALSERRPF